MHPHVGDTIMVHFTGRLDDGRIFATSREREPLKVTVGDHEVIPTLEETLLQMTPGEERTITVPVERAYGPRRPELLLSVDRSDLPREVPARVGHQVQMRQDNGQVRVVTIAGVDDEHVVIDANHPLAGENLTFDLRLVEIRDPRPR
jgi:peptidylprolyl isomerase